MPAMPIVGAAVEREIVAELDDIAKRDGLTRSQVIRQCLIMSLPKRKAWKPTPVEPPKV